MGQNSSILHVTQMNSNEAKNQINKNTQYELIHIKPIKFKC